MIDVPSMDGQQIDRLLNEIESDYPTCGHKCLELMDACLDLVAGSLPGVATDGHRTLKAYLAGVAGELSLEANRTECWSYLDQLEVGRYDLTDPVVCAVRAVICGLSPVDSLARDDLVDSLGFFLDLVNAVEPHYEDEALLLRKVFPKK